MEPINLKLHTVVLLVGPSNSGKSFFSKNHLIPGLTKSLCDASKLAGGEHMPAPVITYVSSDDIRRDILSDPTAHKYDPRMMHVSDKAFKQLHQRIDTAMEWPHNAQFIIVDTTGLNEAFRKKIVAQAKAGQYNVAAIVFDYKDADEYLRHVPEDMQDKRILFTHMKKLRTDVWRNMSRDTYDQIFRVRSKDFENHPVSVQHADMYARFFLNPAVNYDVVGDVHGCFHELQAMILKLGHQITEEPGFPGGKIVCAPGRGLIFVGDLIDKGPMSYETLRFVTSNVVARHGVECVWGNHENFVYQFLTGKLKDTGMPADRRKKYFSSTEEFCISQEMMGDAIYQLQRLNDASAPFLVHPRFIVTHAPCEAKYLGKLDRLSIKKQRGQTGRKHREECADDATYLQETEKHFQYLRDQAIGNAPYHVFGHVSFRSCLLYRNKVGIDTGCQVGGQLSAVSIPARGGKVFFMHEKSRQPETERLFDLFRNFDSAPRIDLANLEGRDYGRVMWAARDKVAFISGTIAPADADREKGELESLEKALDYYQEAGVKRVILQPKYMGSRCNVYLARKLEDCFAVSRNGYRIKHVDLTGVFKTLQEKFKESLRVNKLLILDGELMPWHALGKGLIDETYRIVEHGLRSEFDFLRDAGLEELVVKANEERVSCGFEADKNLMKKDDLYKKYGQARGHSFRCLGEVGDLQLQARAEALKVYSDQIEIFGSPGEASFKPFGILKLINDDGNEVNMQGAGHSNEHQFEYVSDDGFCAIDPSNPISREAAHKFFDGIVSDLKMEGIVMKPSEIVDGIAPAIKVRGPNYLTLIYGYDYKFPQKYQRLINSKRVSKKMRTSINEFKLGQRMLGFKTEDMHEQNEEYVQTIAAMVLEEKSEKELDPRL